MNLYICNSLDLIVGTIASVYDCKYDSKEKISKQWRGIHIYKTFFIYRITITKYYRVAKTGDVVVRIKCNDPLRIW